MDVHQRSSTLLVADLREVFAQWTAGEQQSLAGLLRRLVPDMTSSPPGAIWTELGHEGFVVVVLPTYFSGGAPNSIVLHP
ncbi:MAG: hypothetical protein ABUT39_05285 [Acidobacteriota bacterium]